MRTLQLGLSIVRATIAAPPERAQDVLARLHHRGFQLGLANDPLKDCGQGRQVVRACTVERFDVPERSMRDLNRLAGQAAIRELERLAEQLLGGRVQKAPSPEEAATHTWAEVYDATEAEETHFAVFAQDDDDADRQLEVLCAAVNFGRRVTVRWPSGWDSYGWSTLGSREG